MQCRWNNFWGLVKITKISYNNNRFQGSWFQVWSHPTNPDPLKIFKRLLWSSFWIRRLQLLTWTHFKDLKSKNLSKEKKNFRPLSIKSQVRGGGVGCVGLYLHLFVKVWPKDWSLMVQFVVVTMHIRLCSFLWFVRLRFYSCFHPCSIKQLWVNIK